MREQEKAEARFCRARALWHATVQLKIVRYPTALQSHAFVRTSSGLALMRDIVAFAITKPSARRVDRRLDGRSIFSLVAGVTAAVLIGVVLGLCVRAGV